MESLKSLKKEIGPLKIKQEGKIYKVDIIKELQINPNRINSELTEQPSSYYFLCLLKNKHISERDRLEVERDSAFSSAYVAAKESNPNVNNDTAEHKARKSKPYVIACERYIQAKEEAQNLLDICKSFEQRGNLIQTISSNIRKTI